jgi:hypothetical protein
MLRSALTRRGTRATGAPRKPREGTKQEVVLAMLRRPEGATVAQIAEATGWAQHTVRGFFAGLKKRQGITVEIAERIRQVGPNKQGAKGSTWGKKTHPGAYSVVQSPPWLTVGKSGRKATRSSTLGSSGASSQDGGHGQKRTTMHNDLPVG